VVVFTFAVEFLDVLRILISPFLNTHAFLHSSAIPSLNDSKLACKLSASHEKHFINFTLLRHYQTQLCIYLVTISNMIADPVGRAV